MDLRLVSVVHVKIYYTIKINKVFLIMCDFKVVRFFF